jgi:hypothetical protein
MNEVTCLYGSGKAIVLHTNHWHWVYDIAKGASVPVKDVLDAVDQLARIDPRS